MRSLAAVIALGLGLALAGAASAATIKVENAWIRATPPGAPTAAGYATIVNEGSAPDRLLSASTSAAASVLPHTMSTAGGIMRMRAATGGLPIGPKATLRLSPDGDHLMLMGVKRPLKAGEHVRMVLKFQRAGEVAADFAVRLAPPPAAGGMGGMRM